MIHANTLKNAKTVVSKTLVDPQQIISNYILDYICKEVKEADKKGNSYAIINISQKCYSEATLQILRLYGYKLEFTDDCQFPGTYIYWNKL